MYSVGKGTAVFADTAAYRELESDHTDLRAVNTCRLQDAGERRVLMGMVALTIQTRQIPYKEKYSGNSGICV